MTRLRLVMRVLLIVAISLVGALPFAPLSLAGMDEAAATAGDCGTPTPDCDGPALHGSLTACAAGTCLSSCTLAVPAQTAGRSAARTLGWIAGPAPLLLMHARAPDTPPPRRVVHA